MRTSSSPAKICDMVTGNETKSGVGDAPAEAPPLYAERFQLIFGFGRGLIERSRGENKRPSGLTFWHASTPALERIYRAKAKFEENGRPAPHRFIADQIDELRHGDPDSQAAWRELSKLSPSQRRHQVLDERTKFNRAVLATAVAFEPEHLVSDESMNRALDTLDNVALATLAGGVIEYLTGRSSLLKRHAESFRELCETHANAVLIDQLFHIAARRLFESHSSGIPSASTWPEAYVTLRNSQPGQELRRAAAQSRRQRTL